MYTCPSITEAKFRATRKGEARKLWLRWPPRAQALKNARRRVQVDTFKNGKPKMGFEHRCADCHEWFPQESGKPTVEVDHNEAVGGFSDDITKWGEELGQIYQRLLVGVEDLTILCHDCHAKKTAKERKK